MSETNQVLCTNVLLKQPASLVFRGVRDHGRGAEEDSGKMLKSRVPISTPVWPPEPGRAVGNQEGAQMIAVILPWAVSMNSVLYPAAMASEARGPNPCIYLVLLVQGSRGGSRRELCKVQTTDNMQRTHMRL